VFTYAYFTLSKKFLDFMAKKVFKIEDMEFEWNFYPKKWLKINFGIFAEFLWNFNLFKFNIYLN